MLLLRHFPPPCIASEKFGIAVGITLLTGTPLEDEKSEEKGFEFQISRSQFSLFPSFISNFKQS